LESGIAWIVQQGDIESNSEDPPPGFFSNPEVVEEVQDTPLQPIVLMWYLLAKLEFRLKLGDAVFRKLEEEIGRTSLLGGMVGYHHLKIDHALASSRLSNLIPDFVTYSADLATLARESNPELAARSDSAELLRLLFAALVRLVGSGQLNSAPLARWKKEIKSASQFDSSLLSWLNYVASLECADTIDLLKVVRDAAAAPENRVVAALVASARSDIDPENRFYSNVIITITDFNSSWLEVTGDPTAKLISDGWRDAAINEKFALKNPNITSPRIVAECDDTGSVGLKKAARVLLEARNAVNSRVRGFELEKLQALSGE